VNDSEQNKEQQETTRVFRRDILAPLIADYWVKIYVEKTQTPAHWESAVRWAIRWFEDGFTADELTAHMDAQLDAIIKASLANPDSPIPTNRIDDMPDPVRRAAPGALQ